MSFGIGEKFASRYGTVVVESLAPGGVNCRFLDGEKKGETQFFPLGDPTPVRSSSPRRTAAAPRSFRLPATYCPGNARQAYTIGYLSAKAWLDAEVPETGQHSFEAKYKSVTRDSPTPGTDHYVLLHGGADKWGPELRIYFPIPSTGRSSLEFPPGVSPVSSTTPGILRINKNTFWWQLVQIGFRLGHSHDTTEMRRKLAGSFLPDVERGISS